MVCVRHETRSSWTSRSRSDWWLGSVSEDMVISQHAREGCGRRCAIFEVLVVSVTQTSLVSGSHLFRDMSPEEYRNSWFRSEIAAISSRQQSLVP